MMNALLFLGILVLIGTLFDLVRIYCNQRTLVNKIAESNNSTKERIEVTGEEKIEAESNNSTREGVE